MLYGPMTLYDTNKSWAPPVGYTFRRVDPNGAFIRVQFLRETEVTGGVKLSYIYVYVNDMGREVLRTEEEHFLSTEVEPETPSVSRWYKFVDAFYLTLMGIEEMFKWHKN